MTPWSTKLGHFIPIKVSLLVNEYDRLYIKEIIRFHRSPSSNISHRGTQFTSNFRRSFKSRLGSKATFHPKIYGQAKFSMKTLVDMLKVCVIDFQDNWDYHPPLIELSYNNSYNSTISMAPIEALYGMSVDPWLGGMR